MSYTSLMYHIIFSTKDRRPLLCSDALSQISKYMGGIARQLSATLMEANGPADHIHLAALLPPTLTVADFLRNVKAGSSGWIHKTFPQMADFRWQDGYSAFSVSRSGLPKVMAYIRNQHEHHKHVTFQEELLEFLEKHGVEYDERYIWS